MNDPQAKIFSALLLAALLATPASAVLHLDGSRDLAVPTDGTLAPWLLEGRVGSGLGTPIAPNLFIAAQHYSGVGTQETIYYGPYDHPTGYAANASWDIPGTDLRIFRINGTFDHYAKLYDAGASGPETGRDLFVVGRGGVAGSAYNVGTEQRGWYWTNSEGNQSSGRSTVAGTETDATYGGLVRFDFAGSDGLALTGGDSGGGLFVLVGDEWQLAGVNLGTDGPWSRTATGTLENAAIFDARGLYYSQGTSLPRGYEPDGPDAVPGSSYASSISSNRAAINGIFDITDNDALIPEPTTLAVTVMLTLAAGRRRRPLAS